MSNDFSDLLGDEPPRSKRGRPTREEAAAKLQAHMSNALPHYTEFRRPVGVTFFANILGKQPKQIQKRLEKCPVDSWVTHGGKQQPMYDFLTGMAYLIPPQGNIEDWFSQQNAASLPPYVNKMWWDSAHQRNRVMNQSNQLWHDDDVMMVFGRVLMLIREESKSWVDDLPEKDLLSNQQYNAIVDATNRLNSQIRQALIEMPHQFRTLSMAHTIHNELNAAGGLPDDEPKATDDDA